MSSLQYPIGANWHRIIWKLEQPDPQEQSLSYFREHFCGGDADEFWLEPESYRGPTVTFGQGPARKEFPTNSLCYRVRFIGNDMREPWNDCLLFPRGSERLEFDQQGHPNAGGETERLVGRTAVNGQPAVLTLYMDARPGTQPTQLRILAEPQGVGGHFGMGIAHQ